MRRAYRRTGGRLSSRPRTRDSFTHRRSTQAATRGDLRSGHVAHAGRRIAERPPRHRPLVRAGAAGDLAARRRSPGTAAGRAARLPLRAAAAGSGTGPNHCLLPSARSAGRREAGDAPTPQPGVPVETIAANHVVDGLVLHRLWQAARGGSRAAAAAGGGVFSQGCHRGTRPRSAM